MCTTRPRQLPQLGKWYHAGIPNWGFGNAQVSPTRDACISCEAKFDVILVFCGQRTSGSLWAKAAAAQPAPRSEAAPLALELYSVPETGPAPDARAGAARVFNSRVGPRRGLPFRRWRDRPRSTSVGPDRPRSASTCFFRSRSVSAGISWPPSALIGLGRSRSASVGLDRSRK